MRAYEIILKKRNGMELTPEEIGFMVHGFTKGEIPDYQMSVFLMAVWFKKMTGKERACLTLEMLNSGTKFDLSDIPGVKIDKHSTGGVGDGLSIPLAPLIAACGGVVPMMSGRGLGHTGGTLDKLESIPGYSVAIDEKKLNKLLTEVGAVIMGQTDNIAPADKKIYALRDVTTTVDSLDLISGSIMSKKLAEGMSALVLDVKTGKGAFMQTLDDSIALAKSLVEIGANLGKDMFAFISDMNQPLGNAVGNALEIKQSIDILRGQGPADITELLYVIASRMLVMCKITDNIEAGRELVIEKVQNGEGLKKFAALIAGQNGNPAVVDDPSLLPRAKMVEDIPSPADGFIAEIDAGIVGLSSIHLGAGRVTLESKLDYGAGYILKKKVGDSVKKGEPLAEVHVSDEKSKKVAEEKFLSAYKFSDTKVNVPPLIYGFVTTEGFTRQEISRP